MNYIVDDIGQAVANMRPIDSNYPHGLTDYLSSVNTKEENQQLMPFYMYGHRLEIANRLLEQDKDKVYKYRKYPLIALRLDIDEHKADGVIAYNLNLAILTYTDKNWNAEQRYTNIFKPILYPLYDRFMAELRNSGLFMWDGEQSFPEHHKIDRPFWGIAQSEGNTKYIFNDPLDAIEITDLKLKQNIKC